MKRLVQTAYEDLAAHKDAIYSKLIIACSYSIGRYTADDLMGYIQNNEMQIWLAFDDDDLDGFILTQILEYPQTKVLKILCLMGVRVEGWQALMRVMGDWLPFVRQIEDWSKSHGCTVSQIECPATWELYMRNEDYKRTHVLLERKL